MVRTKAGNSFSSLIQRISGRIITDSSEVNLAISNSAVEDCELRDKPFIPSNFAAEIVPDGYGFLDRTENSDIGKSSRRKGPNLAAPADEPRWDRRACGNHPVEFHPEIKILHHHIGQTEDEIPIDRLGGHIAADNVREKPLRERSLGYTDDKVVSSIGRIEDDPGLLRIVHRRPDFTARIDDRFPGPMVDVAIYITRPQYGNEFLRRHRGVGCVYYNHAMHAPGDLHGRFQRFSAEFPDDLF